MINKLIKRKNMDFRNLQFDTLEMIFKIDPIYPISLSGILLNYYAVFPIFV